VLYCVADIALTFLTLAYMTGLRVDSKCWARNTVKDGGSIVDPDVIALMFYFISYLRVREIGLLDVNDRDDDEPL